MHFLGFCQWLQHTAIGKAVSQSLWMFPTIEVVHIFGMTILVGTTWVLNLHLLGLSKRRQPFLQVAERLLPWLWTGFGVNFLTGSLLFSSEAEKMYNNPYFRIKILLILLLTVNAVIFRMTVHRAAAWKDVTRAPIGFRIAGCASLLLWVGVIAASRWAAYL
jgi:uncharacterized membrane protein